MIRNKTRSMVALLLAFFMALGFISVKATSAETQSSSVRIALVHIPDDVVRPLLPDFQAQTGLRAEIVYTGSDPFSVAREGKADVVISHYGHSGVESFVTEGLGLWPHPVFANQMVLLGPPADPAHVRGLTNAAEAFARIAASKSLFIVNNTAGARYLEDIIWKSAGVPPNSNWHIDPKVEGIDAVDTASKKGAYVLWGIAPFLRQKQKEELILEPLVIGDPIFQRIMVSIVVNPAKIHGTNVDGAKAFEKFLISPSTQSRIRAFRYPGIDQQVWWPAGRHNSAKE